MATATASREGEQHLIGRGPNLVKWGSVFAGAIAGIAVFLLLGALWGALAYQDVVSTDLTASDNVNVDFISDNFEWFLAGSGAFAALLGGFFAGWFGSVRGAGSGMINGFMTWALLTVASVIFGAPSLFGIGGTAGADALEFGALWAPFISLAVGLGLAMIGGSMGGAAKRPKWLFEPQAVDVTELVERPQGIFLETRHIDLRDRERPYGANDVREREMTTR